MMSIDRNHNSTELQLLIKICFSPGSLKKEDFITIDEQRLYTLAQWHGVRNLLLMGISSGLVSDKLYQHLHAGATKSTFQALFQTNALTTLLSAFNEASVPYYAYKGIVWSQWLYNDLNTRSSGDIDVLIPKEYFQKAIQVATEQGYILNDYWNYLMDDNKEYIRDAFYRTDYHVPLTHTSGLTLELHWQPAYTRLSYDFPSEEWKVWKSDIELQRQKVVMFKNEYQLLLLIMHHGGKERWDQLKYVADLVAYLHRYGASTDWDLVFELAVSKGILNLVKHSLAMVNTLVPNHTFALPAFKRKQMNIGPYIRKWSAMEELPENSTWPYFKHGLLVRDGIKFRFKVIKEHLKYFSEFRLLRAKTKWYQTKSF